MVKIVTKEQLERIPLGIKYLKLASPASFKNEKNPIVILERVMPEFIKNLIMKGEKFEISFAKDFGVYRLYTKSYYDWQVLSMEELQTDRKDIFVSFTRKSEIDYEGAEVIFKLGDQLWKIKLQDFTQDYNRFVNFLKVVYENGNLKYSKAIKYKTNGEVGIKEMKTSPTETFERNKTFVLTLEEQKLFDLNPLLTESHGYYN